MAAPQPRVSHTFLSAPPNRKEVSMSRRLFQSVIVLILLVLAPALEWIEGSRVAAGPRTDGSAVVFLAHDYGFAGPDRIPAGVTTMQVINKGQDPHHIQLVKLVQGKTADDFRAAITAEPAR